MYVYVHTYIQYILCIVHKALIHTASKRKYLLLNLAHYLVSQDNIGCKVIIKTVFTRYFTLHSGEMLYLQRKNRTSRPVFPLHKGVKKKSE